MKQTAWRFIPRGAAVLAMLLATAGPAAADDPAPEAPAATTAPATTAPDLSGSWVLNRSQSDDPAAMMGGGPGGGDRDGEGRGGGRGGGRYRGGALGEGEDSTDSPTDVRKGPDAAMVARLDQRIASMDIFQAGNEFNLTDGLDISRMLHTDGREESVWTERGEAKAKAGWRDGALVIDWAGGRGPARTTRFELSADGNQLYVFEQVVKPGEKKPISMRLVYDRRR